MGDAVTALEETIKCVDAAMRALDEVPLTGMLSVKANGIMVVLRSCRRRLTALCAEAEADDD
jgi:hypothetical protein